MHKLARSVDLSNNVILITSSNGSFGNSMCRRMLNTDIKEIRIFSRDEKKQDYNLKVACDFIYFDRIICITS